MVVLEIILIILVLGLAVGGYFLWQDLRKVICLTKDIEQERYDKIFFEPYLARIPQETTILNEEGEETGLKLQANSFQTIIFEKNGLCELFSGAGWVRSFEVNKYYEKIPTQIPAKVKETLLVKSGPSLGFHTITKLPIGTVVEIIDRQGCWAKIRAKNLEEGYVLAILLEKY